MKKYFFLFILLLPMAMADGQTLVPGKPNENGISTERLMRIDNLINDQISKKLIPGAVVLIARNGKIVYHKAYGYSDAEKQTPMKTDDIFRIASQTKAITSLALMMLFEEGKFLLDEPISKYIPAFKTVAVLDKFIEVDSSFTTVPAKREITIRDLLTHTSGISYSGIGTKEANAIYAKNKITNGLGTPNAKLADLVNDVAKMPLMHQPGERFTYGLNTDILGYFVEIISGKPLDVFFQERIFTPLNMNDTYFYLPEAKYNRLATLYAEDKDRKLIQASSEFQNYPKQKGSFFSGGQRA